MQTTEIYTMYQAAKLVLQVNELSVLIIYSHVRVFFCFIEKGKGMSVMQDAPGRQAGTVPWLGYSNIIIRSEPTAFEAKQVVVLLGAGRHPRKMSAGTEESWVIITFESGIQSLCLEGLCLWA